MNYRISSAIAAAATLVTANIAAAAIYSTPYTPATPRTLITSMGPSAVATSPTWTRANGSSSEVNATAPTSVSTNIVNYATNTFTVPTSGLYELFSAQSADGYMHVYADSFNQRANSRTLSQETMIWPRSMAERCRTEAASLAPLTVASPQTYLRA